MGKNTAVNFTSLNAATAAANGSSRWTRGREGLSVGLNWTGTPTAVNVVLEKRIGTGDWTQIGEAMTDAPGDADADFDYQFNEVDGEVRLRLVTITAGTNPTCTGIIRLGG